VSTFLSSVAVLLSTLALMCSGYAAYQVFTLQQKTISNTANSNIIATNQTTPLQTTNTVPPSPASIASPEASASPSPSPTEKPEPVVAIKPGQFVQPAFGDKAQVELLSVKRIKDPETANRDVVNVQMRVRRLVENDIEPAQAIEIFQTTARNPDTSETYKGIDPKRSTGSVDVSSLRPKASADAYVWLRVPNGVDNIDIFVPNTAAFNDVPVVN
jgi:hypothetical protein